VQSTLPRALDDQKVTPVSQPQVEAGKFEPATAFSYKARFEVQPEIAEVVYEGFELARPPAVADEKLVDEQIEHLRKQHSRLEAPEPARPAQSGDVVTIDFTLEVGGVELKEASADGVQLELGSGQILPDIDAALGGKSIDATFDVKTKLPDNNSREDLRGKDATFHVKVRDIKQRVLPAVDDELAKDVGNFQTLVELRADVHTRLTKMLKDQADTSVAEQIVEQLNDKNKVEVPPTLVEQQCRMMEMEILQNARRRGQRTSQEDFQQIHGQVHADSEKKVRAGLLMAAIAKKIGLTITDADIQKGIEELAAETGKNVAKVRAEYAEQQRRQILIGMILEDKVLDVIEAKATIREGHPDKKAPTQASGETAAAAEAKTESQEPASKAKKKSKAKDTESEETR
ncbi:MAG: trigger factor, partial [Polyangiaceae bacterium]